MSNDHEVHEFLLQHLQSIYDNDIETYHTTTSEDLTLYEWWVTPHRLDGVRVAASNESHSTINLAFPATYLKRSVSLYD